MNQSEPARDGGGRLVALAALGVASLVAAIWLGSDVIRQKLDADEAVAIACVEDSRDIRVVGFGHVDVDGGTIALTSAIPGRVAEVFAKEGVHVSAEEPLFRLHADQAHAQLAEAEAMLAQARVRRTQADRSARNHEITRQLQVQMIESAQLRLEAQQREVDQLTKLADSSVVPSEKLNAAKDLVAQLRSSVAAETIKLSQLDLDVPKEAVELAEAGLRLAEAKLEEAKTNLDQHTVKAPCDGIALRVNLATGQMTGPMAGAPAVWFAPDKARIIRCEIDQAFASRVAIGMHADVYDDLMEGAHWEGTVTRCGEWIAQRRSLLDEPFQKNDVRTLECIIELTPGQPELRIGQRMRVVLSSAPLVAPQASLHAKRASGTQR